MTSTASACATAAAMRSSHLPDRRQALAAADGMRCDTDGNLWAGARPGVQIIAPDGAVDRHDSPS